MNGPTEITYVGGSTALLAVGGLQFIIDPTFDPPAPSHQPPGRPYRIQPAALSVGELPAIDVALVSHDQHPDNLDAPGRELVAGIATVLTTPEGGDRLSPVGRRPEDGLRQR